MTKPDAYDTLLASLLSWGLVRSVDTPDGEQWVLEQAAQERLSFLAGRHGTWSAEDLVYLGHRCAGCGERRLTHLVAGKYLCDECRPVEGSGAGRRGRKSRPT